MDPKQGSPGAQNQNAYFQNPPPPPAYTTGYVNQGS